MKSEKPYEKQVERLLYALNCSKISEAGKRLGYKSGNAITNWKTDGLNFNRIAEYYPNISVNYLKTGEGKPFNNRSQMIGDTVQDLRDHVAQLKESLSQGEVREPSPDELKTRVQLKKELDELMKLNDQQIEKLIE